ncbi:ArsR/SmtB family transcription factor [Brucella anthropi]|uniref:Winged helix-turn-helix transcriptional regulator n=1 Tax=Brucella anthropi TaxID=529 RepID=A0A6L3YYK8_BRUAN|nr:MULTISPECIES: metalloregulator ArsR/SmtB family transcription factor [Brucella]KAB2736211.1 winged helix-turn-helix transcriptional regulator [Brucella anthropi]KAB2756287.1 winged helix-turn-helix transcriptional regulator [Brucella anthropi]KAB2764434.1 winged helix-turn-helix transcriptional regulator [Brucella anthropi]MBM6397226.1 winged helix-turn-helix transcriptional regulator [Brucella anthropi]UVV69510.1 metalloregulator ArsR/SmtB family transcription factor [Brucella anthropi]
MENEEAITAFAALAQLTRLDTFRLLVKHEPAGIPAGELARMLDVPQNTMSAHLATLSRSGLVKGERQSRSIIYRADLDRFRELTLFMINDCCGGNAKLCAPLIESLTPCCEPKAATQ